MNNKDYFTKIRVTGNLRDVANSAWISTINEARAKSRSDEDVLRVVRFLAENLHTSPFESVTISVESDNLDEVLYPYYKNKYVRFLEKENGTYMITTDLLNFAKISYHNNFSTSLWRVFEEEEKEIAGVVKRINFGLSDQYDGDISSIIEGHNMSVELVSSHIADDIRHSRATWRVRCPLSIAVQILRHRAGSFNMVSGRYKTIRQDFVNLSNDIKDISSKMFREKETSFGLDEMFENMSSSKSIYLNMMKSLKQNKDNGNITNEEYKRMREYVRFILPEGRMTELYITFYLDDFNHFLKLRKTSHAQSEHIWIAREMEKKLENKVKK